jgi:endonuclease/exonuclease/phosphatase family metal-dependent hydrolase
MRTVAKVLGSIAVVLLTACADSGTTPSTNQAMSFGGTEPARQITVMSRNMYLGAEHNALRIALSNGTTSDDNAAILAAYRTLKQTDYDLRVEAVVNEIVRNRPAVVGLQEVSQIDIELASIEDVPMSIHGDFMVDLQNEIAHRELPYVVASKVQNWVAAPAAGVKLVDFDVVLVDPTQVRVNAIFSHTFSNNLGSVNGLTQVRGWTGIEATYAGQPFVFVSTQLEQGAENAHLRAEQAAELMQAMANRPRVILLADLNDVPGSRAYRRIGESSFKDGWRDLRPEEPGFTGMMQPDLATEHPRLTQRIDFVFAKGISFPQEGLIGDILLTGIGKTDRIQGPEHPIWPSDHAGVVARFRLPFMTIDE